MGNDRERSPARILEKVSRNINGCNFFTTSDRFVKELFINYIESINHKKNKQRTKGKIKPDARAILNPSEFKKYYGHESQQTQLPQ